MAVSRGKGEKVVEEDKEGDGPEAEKGEREGGGMGGGEDDVGECIFTLKD